MLLMRLLLALLLFAVGVSAYSQPPKDGVESAANAYQIRRDNQRGTRDNPLVIESHSAESSDAKAQKEQAEKDEHSHAESLIAIGTVVLAGITAILAVATIVLAIFTYQLWRETKTLREDAGKAAVDQAANTKTGLEIAGRQEALIAKQTSLLKEQQGLARLQYHAANRPKLRIRNVVSPSPSAASDPAESQFAAGGLVSGQLFITNIGAESASVVHSHCTVFAGNQWLPMRAPYEGKEPNEFLPKDSFLEPGKTVIGEFRSEAPLGVNAHHIAQGNMSVRLWVMGWIDYIDPLGYVRRSRFCRVWNAERWRFTQVSDEDYEHED